ncbi:2-amino-4-hydroxy-6-hydroxymethyldihydropteridine diphosphokinase [Thiohalobacter thiocyanaticus]|uniref:2-amino-4-hydroxy-6-hydroxymethyldihydropteridine diphosphokinase n=1 Tax=Thiohalobacter thiocyanaticus TaxID=585455 RepID=A0A426QJ28_9GAMM|nr:2-amino-4-hydroxy-6-hydroxymethyldihydropteridine diphosphokinase [Thiohalobacter thiocyanaticus]RRQ21763.1 2-amino-4-hydroxy-6-hydroxymethyldihydropteridine diphosphokinase [Thiohalobacter thiocyanaticus]
MAEVFVSIGSNIDRERNVARGVELLRERFGELRLSPVYETRAVGFDGENFYNLVAAFTTDAPVEVINDELHLIEDACGRDRSGPRFASRTLDIDLLLYDNEVRESESMTLPRREITEQAFVLKPLADIAGERRHPVLGKTYNELWQAFAHSESDLHEVPFPF